MLILTLLRIICAERGDIALDKIHCRGFLSIETLSLDSRFIPRPAAGYLGFYTPGHSSLTVAVVLLVVVYWLLASFFFFPVDQIDLRVEREPHSQ